MRSVTLISLKLDRTQTPLYSSLELELCANHTPELPSLLLLLLKSLPELLARLRPDISAV